MEISFQAAAPVNNGQDCLFPVYGSRRKKANELRSDLLSHPAVGIINRKSSMRGIRQHGTLERLFKAPSPTRNTRSKQP